MGSKNSTPAPDPKLVEAQIRSLDKQNEAIDAMQALSQEMAPLQRAQLEQSMAQTAQNMAQADVLQQWNEADRDYLIGKRSQLDGMHTRMLQDANNYSEEDRRRQLAAQSDSDVAQAFHVARDTNTRAAQRMGVNPNDGRMAAQGAQLAASEALARVQGRKIAGDTARTEGRQLVDRAANALAGFPAMSTGTVGTGTGVLGAGVGAMGAGVSAFQQGMSGLYQPYRDVAGAAGQMGSNATSAYNSQVNAYQAGQQSGDGFGMLLGLAGKAIFSDRRLKKNIQLVGKDERTGLNIYEYEFKNGDGTRWRGVMADEVKQKYPGAVISMRNGFDMVDYSALGVKFEAVKELK